MKRKQRPRDLEQPRAPYPTCHFPDDTESTDPGVFYERYRLKTGGGEGGDLDDQKQIVSWSRSKKISLFCFGRLMVGKKTRGNLKLLRVARLSSPHSSPNGPKFTATSWCTQRTQVVLVKGRGTTGPTKTPMSQQHTSFPKHDISEVHAGRLTHLSGPHK